MPYELGMVKDLLFVPFMHTLANDIFIWHFSLFLFFSLFFITRNLSNPPFFFVIILFFLVLKF